MELYNGIHLNNNMFQFKRKKYQSLSDEMLVQMYRDKQDMQCIGILYERYSHLVLGVALKYMKDGQLAEDICMQVFESLIQKLANYQIGYFKSWLYMVTKNECLMLLRKKNHAIPLELSQVENEESERDFEQDELNLTLLEQKIDHLKEEQRKCIQLFYLKERSYYEISIELNISLKNVKSAIQNGKRNLKLLLEKENEFTK